MSLNLIAYLRRSTTKQDVSLEAQKADIANWALKNKHNVIGEFKETITGTEALEKRDALMAALVAVRKHGADGIVAFDRSRFARSVLTMAVLESMLSESNAKLFTVHDSNDDNPDAWLVNSIKDVLNQYHVIQTRIRTKAALATKKAQRLRVGEIAYGYRLADDGIHLQPDHNEQSLLERAKELRAEGASFRQIANQLYVEGYTSRKGTKLNPAQVWRSMKQGLAADLEPP